MFAPKMVASICELKHRRLNFCTTCTKKVLNFRLTLFGHFRQCVYQFAINVATLVLP